MKVSLIHKGSWHDVLNACRTTVGKNHLQKDPSQKFIREILLAEHSPIRLFQVHWSWYDLPYWVSVHFVRHKVGIEHWVRTQREDRTGVERDILPQGALVTHECMANAQALINISRKRLCNQAHPLTRRAWTLLLGALEEPQLVSVCVPECVYRGFCPEVAPCGYANTAAYTKARKAYINGQTL